MVLLAVIGMFGVAKLQEHPIHSQQKQYGIAKNKIAASLKSMD